MQAGLAPMKRNQETMACNLRGCVSGRSAEARWAGRGFVSRDWHNPRQMPREERIRGGAVIEPDWTGQG